MSFPEFSIKRRVRVLMAVTLYSCLGAIALYLQLEFTQEVDFSKGVWPGFALRIVQEIVER